MRRTFKWYVGVDEEFLKEAFKSDQTPPTKESHPQYRYVIGPFKTRRGARWAAVHVGWYHVIEAEQLAKLDPLWR